MVVRDDVAFRRHDNAGAERILHHRFLVRVAKLPWVPVKKIRWIKLILAADWHLLRGLDADHGRDDRAYQRPALLIEVFEPDNILRVYGRRRGERILFRCDSQKPDAAGLEP